MQQPLQPNQQSLLSMVETFNEVHYDLGDKADQLGEAENYEAREKVLINRMNQTDNFCERLEKLIPVVFGPGAQQTALQIIARIREDISSIRGKYP